MWTEGDITIASPLTTDYDVARRFFFGDTNCSETVDTGTDVNGEPKEKPKKDTTTAVREYVQRHRALFGEVTVESRVKEKIA